ncbi:MAG: hypothetical protein KC457_00875, partial [Myxococcales bacterium]|nr:hypothetical protein [Myxococcales bacterium]
MPLSDLANINITFGDVPISPAGFGTELLLASVTPEQAGNFPGGALTVELEPSSYLTTLSSLGFSSSDLAFVLLVDHFSQARKPQRALLGRRATPEAQVVTYTVEAQADGLYTVVINGVATDPVDGTGLTIEQ